MHSTLPARRLRMEPASVRWLSRRAPRRSRRWRPWPQQWHTSSCDDGCTSCSQHVDHASVVLLLVLAASVGEGFPVRATSVSRVAIAMAAHEHTISALGFGHLGVPSGFGSKLFRFPAPRSAGLSGGHAAFSLRAILKSKPSYPAMPPVVARSGRPEAHQHVRAARADVSQQEGEVWRSQRRFFWLCGRVAYTGCHRRLRYVPNAAGGVAIGRNNAS